MTTITICTTCRQPALRDDKERTPCGEAMLQAVTEAAADVAAVRVRPVACLMGCEHGYNIAISDDAKLTYVLGRFVPGAEAAQAIVDYAAKHAESPTGVVPFREWPQGVKGHFVARVPPLNPLPEL
jgi:predicted metal-binding protein